MLIIPSQFSYSKMCTLDLRRLTIEMPNAREYKEKVEENENETKMERETKDEFGTR